MEPCLLIGRLSLIETDAQARKWGAVYHRGLGGRIARRMDEPDTTISPGTSSATKSGVLTRHAYSVNDPPIERSTGHEMP